MDVVGSAKRVWEWLADRPRRGLALAIALSCVLRLPFIATPFGNDEGGYLYIAQQWSGHGHWLYGDQWVDRPPALLLLFKLIAVLGGTPVAMRLVAMAIATLLVAAAWYAGRQLAGGDGAVAAALCAAALGSNPAIQGDELIGDGVGAALVTLSFALVLAALAPQRRRWAASVLAVAAGVAGVTAVLTKQSAILGLVVAGLVLGMRLRRHWSMLIAYGVGVLLPLAATVVWAVAGPGLGMLVNATYDFRVGAAKVMARSSMDAPAGRAAMFLVVMVLSGMVLPLAVVAVDVVTRRGHWRRRLVVVVAAACLVAVTVASLNWFSHYWLAVVPLAAVGVALALGPAERVGVGRLRVRTAVLLTVVVAVGNVLVRLPVDDARPAVADFVARAAAPGDSMTVVWGQANLMEDAGLPTPYPYSWSLPVRVEDPELRLFAATLAGPHAPTWLAEVGSFGQWGLATGAVAPLLARRYHVAAVICGHRIYLRNGFPRPVAAAERETTGPCGAVGS